MLVQMAQKAKGAHGEIPWKDTQREAYISAVVAAIVTVIVTLIVGGPELFVLFWRPLITTIVVLPFGFGLALVAFGVWHAFRR